MRLPTTARKRCNACRYPCCTANEAQDCESMKERSAAQHSTLHSTNTSRTLAQFSHCANYNMQPHQLSNQHQQAISAFSLSCSYRPLRSPIRSFHSRYLGGATPVCLALHKAEGSPGYARCPLGCTPQRMTSMTLQYEGQTFLALRSRATRRCVAGISA